MGWARWRATEKEVAEFFGGKRRVRVNYAESASDVIHHKYTFEVKYGKQIPKCLAVDMPTIFISKGKRYWASTSLCLLPLAWYKKKKRIKFLDDAMEQARGYRGDRIPVVCLKPVRFRGFVFITESYKAMKDLCGVCVKREGERHYNSPPRGLTS